MTLLEFAPLVFFISMVAGFLGALTGLGGGVVITPALTLLLGVDIRYAIGASLVSVIATSSGLAVIFGLVLLHAAWQSARHREPAAGDNDSDSLASRLKLDGSYPTPGGR